MLTRARLLGLAAVGLGIALGFAAASGHLVTLSHLWAEEPAKIAPGTRLGGYPVVPPPEQR